MTNPTNPVRPVNSRIEWVSPLILNIDPALAVLLPIDPELVERLARDMRDNGYREEEPIVVWQRPDGLFVVDGHTRLKASLKAYLGKVAIIVMKFPSFDEARRYTLRTQRDRRHTRKADILHALIHSTLNTWGGSRPNESKLSGDNLPPNPTTAATKLDTIADQLGVSLSSVCRMKAFLEEKVTDQEFQDVRDGKLPTHQLLKKHPQDFQNPSAPPAKAVRPRSARSQKYSRLIRSFDREDQEMIESMAKKESKDTIDIILNLARNHLVETVWKPLRKKKPNPLSDGMHKVNPIRRSDLERVTDHVDALSPQATKDAQENANGYAFVSQLLGLIERSTGYRSDGSPVFRKYSGLKNWLSQFGPIHRIRDGNGIHYDLKGYREWVLKSATDRFGREREKVAYKGILNPPDEVVFLFWWLSYHSPDLAFSTIGNSMDFIENQLRSTFGTIPIQLAFHVKTGRPHFEWTLPEYREDLRKAAPGAKSDSKTYSIRHIRSLLNHKIAPPLHPPRWNSILELNWTKALLLMVKKLIGKRHGHLPVPTDQDGLRFIDFMKQQQQASLKDRQLSRVPRTKRKAKKQLDEIVSRQEQIDQRKKLEAAATKQKEELMILQAESGRQRRLTAAAKKMSQITSQVARQTGRTIG